MVKWIFVAILLIPIVEIALFIAAIAILGLLWTLLLMLLTTVAGVLVMRRAGRRRIAQFRVAVTEPNIAGIEGNIGGFLTILAGVLLILPGFFTDLVGGLLLIRPVRNWFDASFQQWIRSRAHRDRTVVDLAPDEWQHVRDRQHPENIGKPSRD
jgi:UPF0716 protein FxsA